MTEDKQLSIDDFKEQAYKDVEAFIKMYTDGIKSNPEYFPTTLPEGEWFEQFLLFLQTND